MTNIKKITWYTTYTLLSTIFLLIVLEFAVRFFYPLINFQGNQRSLYVENKFGQTLGLIENSSGFFFGTEIYTDEYGFRQMNSPVDYDKSWLFLGDSVTFGVGIDTDQTFPQLIQNEFKYIKIWNTSVVGYSTINYLDITEFFLRDHNDIERVVLFFCLNDIYDNLSFKFSIASAKEKVLSFFKSNSKLYLMLKNSLFDRSKTHALYDIGLYKEHSPEIDKHLNDIVSIKSKLDKSKIDFLVVILPYEYQLRVKGLKDPQVLLNNFFAKNNITSLDLYENFTLLNSRDYFLYGDTMHFSSLGHETVAKKMIEILK